ncbi:DUF1810 domain-containing protein [Asticcacaulis sp. W401b]|uniref:DUF1810 domain-containing protein n=1 Tax=Asticcacaulis sp. W401b TaxID=3388666 RepID=UPI003970596E
MSGDPFRLQRFVDAQTPVLDQVTSELAAGRKRTHWMWYIFPQLGGLGYSVMAKHFGIAGLPEAQAYLAHPILSEHLQRCTQLAIDAPTATLNALFGSPDDLKFKSSMTLFDIAANGQAFIFQEALDRWCGGAADERTLALLAKA